MGYLKNQLQLKESRINEANDNFANVNTYERFYC